MAQDALGPYAVAVVFAIGVLLCTIPVNTLLMKRPITDDPPTTFAQYFAGGAREHLSGVLGGAIWGVGALCSFVAACAATLGDLIESSIKRDLGIKDMGGLLPGHGGLMDRLDSLVIVAPIAWMLLMWFVPVG